MDTSGQSSLTIIVVSYRTKKLTMDCIRAVKANTHRDYRLIVLDNDSGDGTVDAVREAYPDVEVIASPENIGFARANNEVAALADSTWLLLLNPDTEVHERAIDNLVNFGEQNPKGGLYGGRTVFPDGTLNIASCWNAITPWSVFCSAFGLTAAFPRTKLFDPEAIGSWQRDSVREVDIISGCLLLIRRETWQELGGFDLRYVMYGEDADLSLRAKAKGHRPMITPDSTIMHLVGASSGGTVGRTAMVAKARSTLIRSYWGHLSKNSGLAMMYMWAFNRYLTSSILMRSAPSRFAPSHAKWGDVWRARRDWLAGYPSSSASPVAGGEGSTVQVSNFKTTTPAPVSDLAEDRSDSP